MPECVSCGSYTTIGHEHYCETEPLRDVPYTDDHGYPEPETIYSYSHPQLREFVEWHQGRDNGRGYQWIGIWRGWCIRVYPQLDSYRGRNVVRWYADCDGRQRVHAKWSAEAAQQAACRWVDAEIFNSTEGLECQTTC